jgi:hypothetical protein
MFDYFIKRARQNYIKRKDRIKKIKDVKDAEEYKREVKEKIKKIYWNNRKFWWRDINNMVMGN